MSRLPSLGLSGPPPVYGLGFGRGEDEDDDGDDDSRETQPPPPLDRLRGGHELLRTCTEVAKKACP